MSSNTSRDWSGHQTSTPGDEENASPNCYLGVGYTHLEIPPRLVFYLVIMHPRMTAVRLNSASKTVVSQAEGMSPPPSPDVTDMLILRYSTGVDSRKSLAVQCCCLFCD